jgi:Beta propeller domain
MRRTATLATFVALAVSACSAGGSIGPLGNAPAVNTPERRPLAAPSLVAFDACDEFLDYVITNALDQVGPYGLGNEFNGWGGPMFLGSDGGFEEIGQSVDSAASASESPSFSGTNNQVVGVDEPDRVKTDGKRIVALVEGRMIVTDVTGDVPVVVGRLSLGNRSVQGLFLAGDKVLLFGSVWTQFHPLTAEDTGFAPQFQSPSIEIVEVDISGDPEIVRIMTIDGQFVSGRMVGDTVRLVSSSSPVGLEWSFPTGTGLRAEQKAIEENREIIRRSSPDNWIPYYIVTDADGRTIDQGSLFECGRASHPTEFSGLNMLSVVTIDFGNGLDVVDSTGVLANGSTVYSSSDNLYVATQNWNDWRWAAGVDDSAEPDGVTTDVHKFDISDPQRTEYLATGTINGYLLNQFAMDEHKGFLRVASTSSPAWWGEQSKSESMVTVLEDDRAGSLNQVGMVDGLGKTEQIYSVRFMRDAGYVVTFRQTDPLYVIDLSDPTNPAVTGELKIPGYSAYLHPVGEGLVLGVGQNADDQGRVKGTQMSLFDVSDPTDPTRIDQISLSEGTNSEVEYDHHAFMYWDPTGLAVMPLQQYNWNEKDGTESGFFGAIGFRVSEGGLDEISRIEHPGAKGNDFDWRGRISRSLVIGDLVYTISDKGIMSSNLDDLDEVAWLGF